MRIRGSPWLARVLAIAFMLPALAPPASARQTEPRSAAAPAVVSAAQLPPEARITIVAIRRGGPFAYDRDGVVFGNFEHLLPLQERGYYREYTVPTPGVSHRGARRIIAGRGGELYYTPDHYRSFRRIRE
jgi:ribonuclease T1